MNHSGLFFTIYLAVGSVILLFAVWSNIPAYGQQPSSLPTISPPSIASSPSNTTISPEVKAKMCNPSNPSLKVVNTTEARICGIPKTVGPAIASSVAPRPKTTTSSPSVAPLAQPSKNIGSSNNTSSGITTTTTTNVPIVLRPLPGGTCPQGYHLVSGAVCIKDLPSAAAPTKTTTPTPAALIPATTNATKSLPISSSSATTQPSRTNPTKNDNNNAANSNNEENFHTKILKSFNKKFK
jgi:hypothetical protein